MWELDGALSSSNHSQDEVPNFDDKKRGQALTQTDRGARGTEESEGGDYRGG
jgi:hypothetical protein